MTYEKTYTDQRGVISRVKIVGTVAELKKKCHKERKSVLKKKKEEGRFGFLIHYLGSSRLPEPSSDGLMDGSGNRRLTFGFMWDKAL